MLRRLLAARAGARRADRAPLEEVVDRVPDGRLAVVRVRPPPLDRGGDFDRLADRPDEVDAPLPLDLR